MDATSGIAAVAAAVLVWSGAAKLADPGPTARALLAARLRPLATPAVARALGAAEVAVGASALVVAGPATALALAVTYAGFVAFIARHRAVGGAGGCGCFGGEDDVAPGALHVVLDLVLGGGALAAAGADRSLYDVVVDDPGVGLPTLLACTVATFLVVTAYTALPRTMELISR